MTSAPTQITPDAHTAPAIEEPRRRSVWLARARGVALLCVLALSAVLQFYRIDDLQPFSDDQATQLTVMRALLVAHHLPLLGLSLSVGHASIGPLFYYMLALPLWLGHLDPTAGVVMIGLFQVATVYLIYRLCLLVGAPWAGLCAAALYATSGLVVYWTRFLWPNTAPFFVVLALYALVALTQRRPRFLVLLAASLAAVVQMQPTAVLLVPVALVWLALTRPPLTWRIVLLSLGVVALLAAPVIYYDLTHHFAETRAWLGYRTTVQPGAPKQTGLGRGAAAMEQYGWRALGLRSRAVADGLLALAVLAVAACALGLTDPRRAALARLLLLWALVYLLAFSVYRGTLRQHYAEPLYPLPFLAIGLLLDLAVRAPVSAVRAVIERPRPRRELVTALGAGLRIATAIVVVALGVVNVRHLRDDGFGLDLYQLDNPAGVQGNRLMLGEMRRAIGLVTTSAAGRPYSVLLVVRGGASGAFQYLLRQAGHPPAATLMPLQFLLVAPEDRSPEMWPAAVRARWRAAPGGFMRLPHLLLWRMQPGARRAGRSGPWHESADTTGAVTAVTVLLGRPGRPGRPGRVLAGFLGGVAISDDGGRHWRRGRWPHATGGRSYITALAWSAACPRRVYAATYDGVVTSTDGGATWRSAATRPGSREVLALLADPARCGAVLAGMRAGIARSTDGGRRWTAVFTAPAGGAVRALDRGAGSQTLYAATNDGVFVSTDGGRSWPPRHRLGGPRPTLALLPRPDRPAGLLAGTADPVGVVASRDGGTAWRPYGRGLRGTIDALLSANGRGATVLAGGDAGLYVSRDGGAWTRVQTLPDGVTVSALSRGGGVLYAATNDGLYRSRDGGATWHE